jgi:hypothetical protein
MLTPFCFRGTGIFFQTGHHLDGKISSYLQLSVTIQHLEDDSGKLNCVAHCFNYFWSFFSTLLTVLTILIKQKLVTFGRYI